MPSHFVPAPAHKRLPKQMQGRVVLGGQYELHSVLGNGSWAVCYTAINVKNPKDVIAVKCIPRKGLSNAYRRSIKEEPEALKVAHESSHDLILKFIGSEEVYDLDEVKKKDGSNSDEDKEECQKELIDILYIGMELCSKYTLSAWTSKNALCGQFEATKKIFLDIVDGLQALHSREIAHRDLKPENILVRPDGTPVIGDFGFATTDMVSTSWGIGTPGYRAPEVLGGLNNERRPYYPQQADTWALGVILLNMVLGDRSKLIWRDAELKDPGFNYYYHHRDTYFTSLFDISDAANDLIQRIFREANDIEDTLDEYCRLTRRICLEDLRSCISKIESFGTGQEISRLNTIAMKATFEDFRLSRMIVGKHRHRRSPQTAAKPIPTLPMNLLPVGRKPLKTDDVPITPPPSRRTSCSDSSDSDSDGPVTPPTQPVDIVQAYLDIYENDTLEIEVEALDLTAPDIHQPPMVTKLSAVAEKEKGKFQKQMQAMRRIRDWNWSSWGLEASSAPRPVA